MLGDERSGDQASNDPEEILQEIEERVRKVRHLEAFEFSERDDGRFQFSLDRPPEELSDQDRETVARLLSKLAHKLRET